MKLIKVPRVSAKAYDAKRPASDLLRRQVAQLRHVVETVRGYGTMTMPATKVKTEGQAAKFIAEATQALHPGTAAARQPPAPPAPAKRSKPQPRRNTPAPTAPKGRRAVRKKAASSRGRRK